MRNLLFLSLAFSLLVQSNGKAQEPSRPTLGIALSGGGAKGLAHIGVLQELEKAGIYPDLVSGTSMGSIVGGLYAIGYNPKQLKKLTLDIDWSTYFSDSYPSSFQPIEERRRAALYQLSFPLENGKIRLPKGLLEGRKILTLLGLLTTPAAGQQDFANYFRPLKIVATDIESGEAYVFDKGPLHQAIRASMAIPSIFAPVMTPDDHLLVDGLVVRNLPVKDAYDLGADVVIGVDVGTPLYQREELNSLLRILEQTASFGSATFNTEQRALADIIIDPELKPYTTLDYGLADSIIERGALTARKAMPVIKAQLEALDIQLPMQPPQRPQLLSDSFFITSISHTGEGHTTERILSKLTRLRAPGMVTRQQIEQQIGELYGSGFFNLVDFQLKPDINGYELAFNASQRPPWQMRLSAAYDSDYEANLLLNLTGRNVIGNGSVLAFDLRIAEYPRATAEYLLYNQTRPSIGLLALASVNYYPGRIYNDRNLSSEFQAHHYATRLAAFSAITKSRYLEIGAISERTTRNPRFFSRAEGENFISRQAFYLLLERETFDRSIYPKKGAHTQLQIRTAFRSFERIQDGERENMGNNLIATLRHQQVIPLSSQFALTADLTGGAVNHQRDNILNRLYLGRNLPQEPLFFNAYGYRHMELPVSGFVSATIGARLEIGADNFVRLAYQYGRATISDGPLIRSSGPILNPNRQDILLQGFALELGSTTIIGPVQFNAEYNPIWGRMNYNLHLGYYF